MHTVIIFVLPVAIHVASEERSLNQNLCKVSHNTNRVCPVRWLEVWLVYVQTAITVVYNEVKFSICLFVNLAAN